MKKQKMNATTLKSALSVLILLALSLLLITGCSPKDDDLSPQSSIQAGFRYHAGKLIAPVEVSFTNESVNSETFSWDFGDGYSSIEKNPKHVYQYGGLFKVKLTAYSGGNQVEVSKTIEIKDAYTKCRLKGFAIDNVPAVKLNGQPWDSHSEPDLLLQIHYKGNSTALFSSGPYPDIATSSLPLVITGLTYEFPKLDQLYDVLIYDDDSPTGTELMGGYYFDMREATSISKHYPDTLLLYKDGFATRIRLFLEWGY